VVAYILWLQRVFIIYRLQRLCILVTEDLFSGCIYIVVTEVSGCIGVKSSVVHLL
jgi:hypothetical protein